MPKPNIILTRPQKQAENFASDLLQRFGSSVSLHQSPLYEIRTLEKPLPQGDLYCFTSQNGISAAAELGLVKGANVIAVGDRSTEIANEFGFAAENGGQDASVLIQTLLQRPLSEKLVYLHGQKISVDIITALQNSGRKLISAVIYEQIAIPLSSDTKDILNRESAAILPLFSQGVVEVLKNEELNLSRHVAVAISEKVAAACLEIGFTQVVTARQPDQKNMIEAIERLMT